MKFQTLYYTGVGSRSTPDHILQKMRAIAKRLAELGLILRSGGARGADSAFEWGVHLFAKQPFSKQIFYAEDADLAYPTPRKESAHKMASDIHPAWHRCSEFARNLHARNCFQVLGINLDTPSQFLVCWTPDGEEVGGTRTAIKLAQNSNIPVFNLGSPNGLKELTKWVKGQPWYEIKLQQPNQTESNDQ